VSSQQIFGSAEMFEVKAGQAGAIQFATGQPFHCNWYSMVQLDATNHDKSCTSYGDPTLEGL